MNSDSPPPATAARRRGLRLLGAGLLGLACLSSAARLSAEDPAPQATPAVDPAASASPVKAQAATQSQTLPALPEAACKPASASSKDKAAPDAGAACCCAAPTPLQLDLPPVRLPTAVVGKLYRHALKASGGQPPYRYQLLSGTLPEGITLDEQGQLSGQATAAQRHPLSIGVSDTQQRQGRQDYSLSVIAHKAPKASAAPAASSAAAQVKPAMKTLPLSDAQAKVPAPRRPQIEVFKLEADTLKLLQPTPSPEEEQALIIEAAKQNADGAASMENAENGMVIEAAAPTTPPATAATAASGAGAEPAKPAPGPLSEAQIKQLVQLLTPLLQVEYPTQQLFEAALDAQLCQFVAELARVSANKQGSKPPPSADFARACPPPNWPQRLEEARKHRAWVESEPAKAVAAAKLKPAATDISWQELAPSIMPPELRAWLVERSGRKYPLSFDKKISWDGAGCGCVQDEIGSQIYGFFPDWWSTDKPLKIDFSRLHRVSVFALAINDDGSLALPEHAASTSTDFVQQARVHGTALDLTLYRNDWQFLKHADGNERANTIERMVREVPNRALAVIDRPLSDWRSRLYGLLPGMGQVNRMGDGITLFLDDLPPREDSAWRGQFDAFHKQLVKALIATLRKGSRDYTLNLVISDRELAQPGAFELNHLFDYLRQAEEPTLLRGRIHSDTAQYKSNTNLTLRFIVLLSEPTSDSKKALRAKLDQSTAIKGGDRRIFLRKLIPLVSPRSKGGQPFADDLIYFDDNFGGVAFWPLPIKEVSTPVDFSQNFDTAFLTGSISDFKLALRGWVCEHRWPLRAAFELLLLIGAACGVALALNCAWRARWGRYMPLGALPPLAVGSLLFAFDPGLKPLRESPFLLWTLLVAVTIWAVLAMRRTQVEKP